MTGDDSASPQAVLRSRRPQTRLETSCTRTGRPRRCLLRNTAAGRREKAVAVRPACTSPRSRTADRFLEKFRERLGKFGLELHPAKTRRIEFGRYAEQNRERRGEGRPETFDFLGFTHISGKNGKGYFTVKRRTIRKRMRGKLQEIKQQLRKRMHDPVPHTGEWLKSVVQGYFNYHAVPGNMDSLRVFRARVTRLWRRILLCRSQTHRLPAARMYALEKRWLPVPHVLHPYPEQRFAASHPR